MTPQQIDAMKLALEALEDRSSLMKWQKARDAINEALAEHAMQEVQRLGQEIEQEPVAWKLVPIEPTYEMLKAMDECSTEGYDERLYAGHAASVYMAAVDVAPAPPQRKPLTDEQFISMVDCDGICIDPQLAFAIKEMVERAHGIKGERYE